MKKSSDEDLEQPIQESELEYNGEQEMLPTPAEKPSAVPPTGTSKPVTQTGASNVTGTPMP